jgi:ATP-dependent Lon protease
MNDKDGITKKEINKKVSPEIETLVEKKLLFFQDVIQKTILHIQKNKILDIIGISEVNSCINSLSELSNKIKEISEININKKTEEIINILQIINNELSNLLKLFGTESLEDLLWICCGNNSVNTYAITEMEKQKFELLKKYFHPTSYKLLIVKKSEEGKVKFDDFTEKSKNLDTLDIEIKIKPFHLRVYGIQLLVHNPQYKKSIIITGIIDDVIVKFLNNKYINNKLKLLNELQPKNIDFVLFNNFLESLNLKDYIYLEVKDIQAKYIGYISNLNLIRQKTIAQIIKDFINSDLYIKRNTIIQLLINSDKCDNQYLAYLLYDLLSNDSSGTIDTQEQTILFDSFPWSIKQFFKDAMKKTIQYTNDLSNFDIQKIPLEQQICLLKVNDNVKEKAMQKLKEVKAKTEDSGSKARQYLEGLLKIPFNIYKRESILNGMNLIKELFVSLLNKQNITENEIKTQYTSLEIIKHIQHYQGSLLTNNSEKLQKIELLINKLTKIELISIYNSLINSNENTTSNNNNKNKSKKWFLDNINSLIKTENIINTNILDNLIKKYEHFDKNKTHSTEITGIINDIEMKYKNINTYIDNVKVTLDKSVHGHDKAKKQIEIIIGQWINGKQDGYCFGFEGPPGVGKTTLAKKGLADCLKDENGESRPFAMIQMGGDSNGSSLHGHNYTYVGSTWGSIVQILMDKKCMNPIIFIDEIDKISKTEHGKEIIGILTHLLDPAQNDSFQDKYFSGIDLDLSKALFILSYNDPEVIDKILLDRVHRIKFKNLSLEEKLEICNIYILPDVYEKMGLQNTINIDKDVLKVIIEEYTLEAGVRKLKEILFEIVGEINIDILKNFKTSYDIPINITIDDIKNKYFKDKHETINRKVPSANEVGYINGMYATTLGMGGTLPIHAKFFPCDKFLDLKLTGLQQDVMKESMHVALTVAWNLTDLENQNKIRSKYDIEMNKCGINIHTGDGAIAKDGPSAGCAITCVLYSLLNNIEIKSEYAITGEIQMSGEVTAIGGLNYKILGSIKCNVKSFLYPKENEKDFKELYEKYKDTGIFKDIKFYGISHVKEALDIILVK